MRRKHRTQPGHKDTEDFACWCDSHRREETKAQRGSIGNFPKRGESLCKCLVFNMLMNSDVLELFSLEKGGNLKKRIKTCFEVAPQNLIIPKQR